MCGKSQETYEALGGDICRSKATSLLVRINDQPRWTVLVRHVSRVVPEVLVAAGSRRAYNVVESLGSTQAGRASANDENIDITEITH